MEINLKMVKNILSLESDNNKKMSEKTKAEMLSLNATLAVPLILRDELIGIILLGKKKSDEYYTVDDLSILMDLARTLAIVINNSITHSLLLEAEKKQAQSERLVSMAYLVTNLSHEMRNPMHVIAGVADDALDAVETELNDITDEKHRKTIDFVSAKLTECMERSDKAEKLFNSITCL